MRVAGPPIVRARRRLHGLLVAIPALAVALVAGQAAASPLAFFTETSQPADSELAAPFTPLVGDFTGDGADDLFVYRPGSGTDLMLIGGQRSSFVGATGGAIQVKSTYTPLVGDFDGDGGADIFWYAPGKAADYLWIFTNQTTVVSIKKSVNGTYKPIVGDFASADGKHRDDIFWYAPGSASDSLWKATAAGNFTSIPESVSGTYQPLVGAFTPDPATGGSTDSTLDIFWYAPGSSPDSLWRGDGTGHFTPKAYVVGGTYQPFVGYFDGYGVQDIFWYAPGGNDSVWLADPDTRTFTTHGVGMSAGYTPITDEFTVPDEPILWWSPTGEDHFWLPQGEPGTWDYTELSNNTDMGAERRPVTGDFDGDGHNDIFWIGSGSTNSALWWGPG